MSEDRVSESFLLASLLGRVATGQAVEVRPSAAQFSAWIQDLRLRLGCDTPSVAIEPARRATLFNPQASRDDDVERGTDWKRLLGISFQMAEITYQRLLSPLPAVDSALLSRFGELLEDRPRPAKGFEQAPIDLASSVRRAAEIKRVLGPGLESVIFIGDDDATSVALALLEPNYRLRVVDIDERVLLSIQKAAAKLGADLTTEQLDLRDGVPFHLTGRFSGAVLDPPRWYAAEVRFLRFAADCLARHEASRVFWCEHPLLTPSYPQVLEKLPALRLRLLEVVENLHRFEATDYYLDDLGPPPPELGLDIEWIRSLVRQSDFWSHLHVLGWAT